MSNITHGESRSVPAEKAEKAENDGYSRGFHNWQTTRAMYSTGEEWIAWYRGWKRGQAERRCQQNGVAA